MPEDRPTVLVAEDDRSVRESLTRALRLEGDAAEIGSLARSFTTMVDALGESRREQQPG